MSFLHAFPMTLGGSWEHTHTTVDANAFEPPHPVEVLPTLSLLLSHSALMVNRCHESSSESWDG